MRKTEKVLVVMVVLGQLMRLMDISGGGLISVAAAFLLSFLYLFLGFALFNGVSFRDIFSKDRFHLKGKEVILSIVLGFALAGSLMGIVLKLQLFQEGNTALGAGILLLIILLPILWRYWKYTCFFKRVVSRIIIYGAIALTLLAMPASWLVDVYYFRYPDYAEQLKEILKNPDRPPVKEFSEEKKNSYPYEEENP